MKSGSPHLTVVGSLNMDCITRVDRLPRAGETVAGKAQSHSFGGKGANQAIAAARQGARVSMIGCVGDDASGRDYRERLIGEGIDVSGLFTAGDATTGSAFIAVDDFADNFIIATPGANGLLRPEHIGQAATLISSASTMLLQWEVPQPAVLEALKLAQEHGVMSVMNPSPMDQSFPWGRYPIHTLIVNQGEAEDIFGEPAVENPETLAGELESHGIEHLVITRGALSTLAITASTCFEIPTLEVSALDTVGAGDAFAGAFAARLAAGDGLEECIRYANICGALTTLEPGAQNAIPLREKVEMALTAC